MRMLDWIRINANYLDTWEEKKEGLCINQHILNAQEAKLDNSQRNHRRRGVAPLCYGLPTGFALSAAILKSHLTRSVPSPAPSSPRAGQTLVYILTPRVN